MDSASPKIALSIKEKIGYGLGDTASNLILQVVFNFLMIFYTDVFGISAAAVGTMMLAVRIFDAVTDPTMGAIADRTRSRHGRYRPYLLYTAIPFAILAILAFTTPDLSGNGKLVYAYVTYAAMMTIYTVINIPYSALGGVITADSNERASVQSYRFAMAMVGGAIATATLLPMVEWLGQGDQVQGYQWAMGVLSTLAAICFLLCFWLTRERVQPAEIEHQSFKEDLMSVLTNTQWWVVAGVAFFLLVLVSMRGAGSAYYMKYYFGREDLTSLFITLSMTASVGGALFANVMSKRMCKVKLFNWGLVGMIVFHGLLYLVPNTQLELAFGIFMVANFCQLIVVPLMFSMIPDTVDYGRLKSERNVMAMSFSTHLLAIKLGLAVGGALTGWILAFYNYVPNEAQQTAEAIFGIKAVFALSSFICSIACLLLMLAFYRLNNDTMQAVRDELAKRAPDASTDAHAYQMLPDGKPA